MGRSNPRASLDFARHPSVSNCLIEDAFGDTFDRAGASNGSETKRGEMSMSEAHAQNVPEKLEKSEAEWRAALTPEQYHVLREKGTERPYTGALTENHETGNYHCAGCGAMLFDSGAKFDSGCGTKEWCGLA